MSKGLEPNTLQCSACTTQQLPSLHCIHVQNGVPHHCFSHMRCMCLDIIHQPPHLVKPMQLSSDEHTENEVDAQLSLKFNFTVAIVTDRLLAGIQQTRLALGKFQILGKNHTFPEIYNWSLLYWLMSPESVLWTAWYLLTTNRSCCPISKYMYFHPGDLESSPLERSQQLMCRKRKQAGFLWRDWLKRYVWS